jgi:hypothetical protein
MDEMFCDFVSQSMAPQGLLRRLLNLCLCAPLSLALKQSYIQYSTVTGYFLQDLNSTDPSTFDYVRLISELGSQKLRHSRPLPTLDSSIDLMLAKMITLKEVAA